MNRRTEIRGLMLAAIGLLFLTPSSQAATLYVDVGGTNPVPPFGGWSTAATNIQDAVDAASAGDQILVTNGIYATGGRNWYGSGTNRVTLTNEVTLQSVNGPAVTSIVGNRVAGTGSALTNAVRCVAIGSRAALSGFTLANGEAGTGNYPNGGGVSQVQSVSAAGTVSNCVLVGNLSTNGVGGGAYRVNLINCQIIGNYATSGGGACASTLVNCTVVSNTASVGGGVYGGSAFGASVLDHCVLRNNVATSIGGGAYAVSMTNCLVAGNSAASEGGGVWTGNNDRVYSCTIVNNSANASGGVREGICVNSIIYLNNAGTYPNGHPLSVVNCCMTPLQVGAGNFTNEPLFADLGAGNYHLQPNSPCINSGVNAYVTTSADLDGNPRVAGGTVDVGAYEYQSPVSMISYVWLQQYDLPITINTDTSDADADGMSNYAEWIAGTNPTNPASLLLMQFPTSSLSGLTVTWQSVSGKIYYLQRATDLGALAAFSTLHSNIVGQASTTSYTDVSATNLGPYFYRIGVQ